LALSLAFVATGTALVPAGAFAETPQQSEGAGLDALLDCRVVRCHFDEGRLVLRCSGALVVLREGDALPGGGWLLARATPEQFTLARRTSPGSDSRLGDRILITRGAGPEPTVQVVRAVQSETLHTIPAPAATGQDSPPERRTARAESPSELSS
jgi:hypothetical protein